MRRRVGVVRVFAGRRSSAYSSASAMTTAVDERFAAKGIVSSAGPAGDSFGEKLARRNLAGAAAPLAGPTRHTRSLLLPPPDPEVVGGTASRRRLSGHHQAVVARGDRSRIRARRETARDGRESPGGRPGRRNGRCRRARKPKRRPRIPIRWRFRARGDCRGRRSALAGSNGDRRAATLSGGSRRSLRP